MEDSEFHTSCPDHLVFSPGLEEDVAVDDDIQKVVDGIDGLPRKASKKERSHKKKKNAKAPISELVIQRPNDAETDSKKKKIKKKKAAVVKGKRLSEALEKSPRSEQGSFSSLASATKSLASANTAATESSYSSASPRPARKRSRKRTNNSKSLNESMLSSNESLLESFSARRRQRSRDKKKHLRHRNMPDEEETDDGGAASSSSPRKKRVPKRSTSLPPPTDKTTPDPRAERRNAKIQKNKKKIQSLDQPPTPKRRTVSPQRHEEDTEDKSQKKKHSDVDSKRKKSRGRSPSKRSKESSSKETEAPASPPLTKKSRGRSTRPTSARRMRSQTPSSRRKAKTTALDPPPPPPPPRLRSCLKKPATTKTAGNNASTSSISLFKSVQFDFTESISGGGDSSGDQQHDNPSAPLWWSQAEIEHRWERNLQIAFLFEESYQKLLGRAYQSCAQEIERASKSSKKKRVATSVSVDLDFGALEQVSPARGLEAELCPAICERQEAHSQAIVDAQEFLWDRQAAPSTIERYLRHQSLQRSRVSQLFALKMAEYDAHAAQSSSAIVIDIPHEQALGLASDHP